MAEGFFTALVDFLTPGERIAYSALRSFAADKVPFNNALSQIRAAGIPIRTQTASDLYAVLQNRADVTQFTRTFGSDAIIPDALHTVPTTNFSEGATHQYTVGTNSDNPLIPEAIYVNSDRGLSENEILAKAADSFKYDEASGMAPSQIGDVFFSVDDARWIGQTL